MQNQEPTNPTNPTLETSQPPKKKLHKAPIQWKIQTSQLPIPHKSPSRILFQGKTHHENQGLFGLLWIVPGKPGSNFSPPFKSWNHPHSPPVPSIRIHRSALSFLDRAFRLANTQKDGHVWRRFDTFSKAHHFLVSTCQISGGVGDFTNKKNKV